MSLLIPTRTTGGRTLPMLLLGGAKRASHVGTGQSHLARTGGQNGILESRARIERKFGIQKALSTQQWNQKFPNAIPLPQAGRGGGRPPPPPPTAPHGIRPPP